MRPSGSGFDLPCRKFTWRLPMTVNFPHVKSIRSRLKAIELRQCVALEYTFLRLAVVVEGIGAKSRVRAAVYFH
jgi:hypothetical protein